jgi:predicted HicB family RNase H-like nuclease
MARPKNPNKYVPLDVRVPPELRDAIEAAAKAKFESLSAYARTALLARLEQDGICPIPQRAA